MRIVSSLFALSCAALVSLPAAVHIGIGFGDKTCRTTTTHRHIHGHGHYHTQRTCRTRPSFHIGFSTTPVRRTYTSTTHVHHYPRPRVQTRHYTNRPVLVRETTANCSSSYTEYYHNGQLKVTGHMQGSQRDGQWTWYDDCGGLLQVGNYTCGRRDGTWIRYSPLGEVRFEAVYNNGRLVKEIRYSNCRVSWL